MDYALITPPTEEPVTLAEAKAYLRVTHTSEDAIIATMVRAARVQCENRTRMSFITQTRRQSFLRPRGRSLGFGLPEVSGDDPDEVVNGIRLVKPPVATVGSVQGMDSEGSLQTIANTFYNFDAPTSTLRWGKGFWGELEESERVHVTYSAGLSVSDFRNHYSDIVDALLMLVEHKYTNRGAEGMLPIPKNVGAILDPYWSSTTYVA